MKKPKETRAPLALRREAETVVEARRLAGEGPSPADDPVRLLHELEVHQIELELQNEELRRAQGDLEEALERYTELYDLAPAGYFTLSAGGVIQQVNLAGARLLGSERARLIGQAMGPLLGSAGRATLGAFLDLVCADGASSRCEVEVGGDPGTARTLELTATRVAGGEACRVVATDVTERRRAQASLAVSENKYRTLYASSGDAVFLLDEHGVFDPNPAAVRVFGAADEIQLRGTLPRDLSPPLQPDGRASGSGALALTELARKTGHARFEWVFRRLDTGATFPAEVVLARLVLDGRAALLATVRDTTERHELQARLAQVDRLASMGRLAASVTHEVNNPLAYVMVNLESLAEDLPRLARAVTRLQETVQERLGPQALAEVAGDDAELLKPAQLDDAVDRVREALEGTRRLWELAKGLGTFARVERTQRTRVDVACVMEDALRLARHETRMRAELVRDYGSVRTVWASEGKLAQVFLNVLVNAAHAIDEGNVEANRITVRILDAGDDVQVEVADTGRGIQPADFPYIFEPFFTTKGIGKGSGLGLSISRNLMTELGGSIHVESKPGVGTRVVMRLGAAAGAPPEDAQPTAG